MADVSRADTIAARLQKFHRKAQPLSAIPKHAGIRPRPPGPLRDDTGIDWNGSVVTEAAKLREQIRRPYFGHLEIQVTVDDPKAYTKPWTVTLRQAHRNRHRADRRGLFGE